MKLFAWEPKFVEKITQSRDKEQDLQFQRVFRGIFLWTTNFLGTSSVLLLTLTGYTLIQKQPLNAAIAFTAFALFNVLKGALERIPMYVQWAMRSLVSLKRIDAFLQEEELEFTKIDIEEKIGFEDAVFQWGIGSDFVLTNLNFMIPTEKLTVIAGPTGSGKTTLLMALLGGCFQCAINW